MIRKEIARLLDMSYGPIILIFLEKDSKRYFVFNSRDEAFAIAGKVFNDRLKDNWYLGDDYAERKLMSGEEALEFLYDRRNMEHESMQFILPESI